jgi:hypothetical protein
MCYRLKFIWLYICIRCWLHKIQYSKLNMLLKKMFKHIISVKIWLSLKKMTYSEICLHRTSSGPTFVFLIDRYLVYTG